MLCSLEEPRGTTAAQSRPLCAAMPPPWSGSSRTPGTARAAPQPAATRAPSRLSLLSFIPPLRQSVLFPREPKIILVLSTRISSPIITRVLCDTKAFFPRPRAARRSAELRAECRQPEGCAPLRSAAPGEPLCGAGAAPCRDTACGCSRPGEKKLVEPFGLPCFGCLI